MGHLEEASLGRPDPRARDASAVKRKSPNSEPDDQGPQATRARYTEVVEFPPEDEEVQDFPTVIEDNRRGARDDEPSLPDPQWSMERSASLVPAAPVLPTSTPPMEGGTPVNRFSVGMPFFMCRLGV